MSALARQRVLPNLYQVAKRGCIIAPLDRAPPPCYGGLGDAMCSCFALRFDSPDDGLWQANRWSVKAKPPVFDIGWRLCCVTRVLSGSAFYGGAYELVADSEPQPYAAAGSRRY
jgi:hypothetical protein